MKHDDKPANPAMPTIVINLNTSSENARSRLIAADTDQRAKTDVHYRPVIGPDACGVCVHGIFRPGDNVGSCKLVAGSIRWRSICDIYLSPTASTSESNHEPG